MYVSEIPKKNMCTSLLPVKLPAKGLQHSKSYKNLKVQFLSKSTFIFTKFYHYLSTFSVDIRFIIPF